MRTTDYIARDVLNELESAMETHAPLNSAHEAYAVILEELDEFWDQVKLRREQRDRNAMRKELVQVAAMAMRAINDIKWDTYCLAGGIDSHDPEPASLTPGP